MMLRRVLRAIVVFTVAVPVILTGVTGTATPDRQLLFFNHAYGVLDRETADAIEHSAYLKDFANFEVRTTTGSGGEVWTGRYLMGRETYLELFGVGDLAGTKLGNTGMAVSTEHQGDSSTVVKRLTGQGIKPIEFTQTRDFGDGKPVPWFDAVYPTDQFDSFFAWSMEYRQEYLNDPRAKIGPPAYPGDVSRDRYINDGYRTRLMRDVTGVRLAVTQRDLDSMLPLYRAGGFVVAPVPGGALVTRGGTTIRLDAVPVAEVGLRQVEFALNQDLGTRREVPLGRSTLTVGPGAQAVWNFPR
ncbi:hypothetical protein JOF53_000193 [Crossiella equi]|uniref:Uncharacterized protein n=1 Tax=Crossiella equi TaxID=130796 RepID=A0ABS5A422_9PSEU|nr:DUF5829 family protein [Crossiella equi]MBP2471321.1 hypothetical protein [Crossiella equi]